MSVIKRAITILYKHLRLSKFHFLSTNNWCGKKPKLKQPLLTAGFGKIWFGENVTIGVKSSSKFWSSYCYIEARSKIARVSIGANCVINNGFSAVSESGEITIGSDCLIGQEVLIVDSDFHQIQPERRARKERSVSSYVKIGNNVFIGANVKILKGTQIGNDSVVGAGSVVTGHFPDRSMIFGNPARLINTIREVE